LRAPQALQELNARFEAAHPTEILRWALEESGLDRVAIASAFQAEGTAVIHMAVCMRPDIPVLFLQTGFHFAETLAFKERLSEMLHLNVVELTGDYTVDSQSQAFGPRLYERDPRQCCEINKVIPWRRALLDLDGWITSMRRDSAWTRSDTPIISREHMGFGHSVVKINPVANWSRQDVWNYIGDHDLPKNPLYDLGYKSIGCAPCTRMTLPGEDERAGRWAGSERTECGMHQRELGNTPRKPDATEGRASDEVALPQYGQQR